ncbi:uncharacterized protein LOC142343041 [Convolutriloba macropyga]|uniref:uncharacterized protein LOC142343041 n=1 Tax=Convolutriloba macropyga TaxID=536237 RepID=UPI003F5222F8
MLLPQRPAHGTNWIDTMLIYFETEKERRQVHLSLSSISADKDNINLVSQQMCSTLSDARKLTCDAFLNLDRTIPYDYCVEGNDPEETVRPCFQKYIDSATEVSHKTAYCLQKQCFDAYEGEPNNAVMRMACEMNCYSGTAENEVENCIQNKCYRQSPQEYNKGFVSF